tara:strand:+ start:14 stop:262 length:249 start_codon:yes stop_codon:yes gene_type:complete
MRKYNITKDNNNFFKVEVSDEYGFTTTVYERNVLDASKFVYDWWENTEKRKKSNDLMSKAILNCIELDKKNGILTENRDNLD